MELLNCGVRLFQALDEQVSDEGGGRDPHIPSLLPQRIFQRPRQRECQVLDWFAETKPARGEPSLPIFLGHILSGISIFGRLT